MERCEYLREKEMASLGGIIFCSLDNTALYRKCCPPKDRDKFFICFEECSLCGILENSKSKSSF